MKKIALFDMDGTLTDTEKVFRDTWMELAVDFGVEPNPEFPKAVCGSNGDNMLRIIHTYYPTVNEEDFKNACFKRVAEKNEKHIPLKEGVLEILEYMKTEGYKMAVGSSNFRSAVEHNLEMAGIRSYFEIVIGGDDVTNAKPHPEVYITAAKALGAEANECYAFEDGMNGLRSALAAGCKTIMMVDLTEPDDEVAPQCAAIYHSFLEVVDALKNNLL